MLLAATPTVIRSFPISVPQPPIPHASPYLFESRRSTHTRSTHLVRTERFAEAWLAAEGYAYELIADSDLHEDPALLSRFAALMICGHSEYWTHEMRQLVEFSSSSMRAVM